MMQDIIEVTTKAETLATVAIVVMAVVIAAGKVGWDIWQRRKGVGKLKNTTKTKTCSSDTPPPVALEVINDSYLLVIASLKEEIDRLKANVDELRRQNERCAAVSAEQELKIQELTRKVNFVLLAKKKKPVVKKKRNK